MIVIFNQNNYRHDLNTGRTSVLLTNFKKVVKKNTQFLFQILLSPP